MSRVLFSISVAWLLFLAAIAGSLVEAASPTQKVVFSFAGVNERYGCLFVAKDQKFFEELGLEVATPDVASRILKLKGRSNVNF